MLVGLLTKKRRVEQKAACRGSTTGKEGPKRLTVMASHINIRTTKLSRKMSHLIIMRSILLSAVLGESYKQMPQWSITISSLSVRCGFNISQSAADIFFAWPHLERHRLSPSITERGARKRHRRGPPPKPFVPLFAFRTPYCRGPLITYGCSCRLGGLLVSFR